MIQNILRSPSLTLIIANIVVFFLALNVTQDKLITFALSNFSLTQTPFSLITHLFLHSGAMHLLFNMIGLFFFGQFLEQRLTNKEFYFLFFSAGIFAGIITVIVNNVLGTTFLGIGASGALMGVVGATIMLFPKTKVIILPLPIPIPLFVAGIGYFLIDSIGFLLDLLSFTNSNVGHLTHLLGLFIGLGVGYYFKKKAPKTKYKIKRETIHVQDASEYMKQHK